MTRARRHPSRAGTAVLAAALVLGACRGDTTRVTVRPNEQLQVMQGWEALIGGTPECNQHAWNLVREQILDLAALDLGINRVRLPLRSGTENPHDSFSPYMRGETSFLDWKRTWSAAVNDDDNPHHANPAGFQWAFLDHIVETQVLPLKQRLQGRGDDLWVDLTYVGGRNTPHGADPEEYAELVLAAFQHLRDRWGLVPQSLEVMNEPNMRRAWSPEQMARALVAAKARLATDGFHPRFVAPATTTMQAALVYLDSMLLVPGVREALTDVSYHRYGGNPAALTKLETRATSLGLRLAMGERMGATHDTLYQDLTVGRVSSWEQFALVHCTLGNPGREEGGTGLYTRFVVDDTLHPLALLNPASRMLRQYFRYVRLGAQRVGATSGDDAVRVTAFVNPDGKQVVVAAADTARALDVHGLAAGRYRISYTTTDADDVVAGDTTLASNGVLRTRIPGRGVLTVFGQ